MIHPVYGETDFRKVDRSKLKQHIPKGRGMIKWAPFATMPQQFSNVRQQIENQNKIARPTLCDDRLEEINELLQEVLASGQLLVIDFYADGYIKQLTMTVDSVDRWGMLIIGTNHANQQMCFVSFMDVVNLTRY